MVENRRKNKKRIDGKIDREQKGDKENRIKNRQRIDEKKDREQKEERYRQNYRYI